MNIPGWVVYIAWCVVTAIVTDICDLHGWQRYVMQGMVLVPSILYLGTIFKPLPRSPLGPPAPSREGAGRGGEGPISNEDR